MLTRIITSLIGVALMTPVMWFSDTYVFPIVLAFFIAVALYEIFACLNLKTKFYLTVPAYILGIAMPFICKYMREFNNFSSFVFAVIFIYLIYLLFCAVIFHKTCDVKTLSMCFMFVIYIIAGISSMQLLRELPNGVFALIPVFLTAWVTDIFAYFTGKLIGKHKLCEAISPKKTIEGSIGGIFFCILVCLIYAVIIFENKGNFLGYIFVFFVSIILSVISQLGDLVMSLIKRKFGIKDFGKLFPGHGGVLDRFDSIIAVSPTLLIILLVVNSITNFI